MPATQGNGPQVPCLSSPYPRAPKMTAPLLSPSPRDPALGSCVSAQHSSPPVRTQTSPSFHPSPPQGAPAPQTSQPLPRGPHLSLGPSPGPPAGTVTNLRAFLPVRLARLGLGTVPLLPLHLDGHLQGLAWCSFTPVPGEDHWLCHWGGHVPTCAGMLPCPCLPGRGVDMWTDLWP